MVWQGLELGLVLGLVSGSGLGLALPGPLQPLLRSGRKGLRYPPQALNEGSG